MIIAMTSHHTTPHHTSHHITPHHITSPIIPHHTHTHTHTHHISHHTTSHIMTSSYKSMSCSSITLIALNDHTSYNTSSVYISHVTTDWSMTWTPLFTTFETYSSTSKTFINTVLLNTSISIAHGQDSKELIRKLVRSFRRKSLSPFWFITD